MANLEARSTLPENLAADAISWMEGLTAWPEVSVEDTIRVLHVGKAKEPRYHGIQAFLLSLAMFENKWPPLPFTPPVFVEQTRDDPKFPLILAKFAINIATVEYRIDNRLALYAS